MDYLCKNSDTLNRRPKVAVKPTVLAIKPTSRGDDLIDLSEPILNVHWSTEKDSKNSGNQMSLKDKMLMVLEALHNVLLRNSGNL